MTGRDHLPQGLETGGAVILRFVHVDVAADFERLVAQAMAVLEQQQGLVAKVVDTDMFARGQPMRVRHREGKRLLIEYRRVQAVHRYHRQRKHTHVELTRPQSLEERAGLVLVEEKLEFRQVALQRRRDARQEIRADGWDEGDPQLTGQGVTGALRHFDDGVGFLEHPARALHDFLARGRKRDPPGLALHQRHAEISLELAYLGGEGRLADKAALRRPAEMPLVRERHQVPEISKIHEPRISRMIDSVY